MSGSTNVEARHLEELGKSLTNGNQVCMKIKNLSDTPMIRGSVACNRGIINSVLPQSIDPNKFECIGLQKIMWYIPFGASGTIAYEMGNWKLCIRYSNPFIGTNKGGFLWMGNNYRVTEYTEGEICQRGMNFEGCDVMEWNSWPNSEFVAEGFITRGSPSYFHVHVRNA